MLETVLPVVAAAVAALLANAAFKPDSFRLARSATIAASPDKVFTLINDLRRFNHWNPFAKPDPQNAVTDGAVTAGARGAYHRQGERPGAGRMQITESVPPRRATAQLDFSMPFEVHNMVDFTVRPQASSSTVTGSMHGPMPCLNRLMTVFFDIDKAVGNDFEAGLASLKALA
jgi:uncharacterized protein YndB with AHSA1/START domain